MNIAKEYCRKFKHKISSFIHSISKKYFSIFEYINGNFKNLQYPRNKIYKVIIVDDIFPHLLSAFRIAEYNTYLEHFPSSVIYSNPTAFPLIQESRNLESVIEEYEKYYPQFKSRVFKFYTTQKLQGSLIYTIFLNNAYNFIDHIERTKASFIFTLYPGGGFQLNQEESDKKLRRVCISPNLKHIIVTQKVTYEYLQNKNFFPIENVSFIYGGVLPSQQLSKDLTNKKYYLNGKNSLDICFVANKYMYQGIDKGYDTFILVAKLLVGYGNIFFHVVGNFDETDIDVTDLKGRIKFYGIQKTNFFPSFYAQMDIILSPNMPFHLTPGAFDGFPTGCCIEASLCGVLIVCTDFLDLNIMYEPNAEILLISNDFKEIFKLIDYLYCNPKIIYNIAKQGQKKTRQIFEIELQMKPRIDILSKFIN